MNHAKFLEYSQHADKVELKYMKLEKFPKHLVHHAKCKLIFLFAFLFASILGFGQDFEEYSQLPKSLDYPIEVRIYKSRGITNSGQVFRMYFDSKVWKSEMIRWFLPKNGSQSGSAKVPIHEPLVSKDGEERLILGLQALNIAYLPIESAFEYKKSKNTVVWSEDDKAWLIEKSIASVVDGNTYTVWYKSGKQTNKFTYSNPESFLKIYPNINELTSFVEILKFIREQYAIDF
ncbi:hypothetical protein [Soonwooa sp.]|uniref:hypothetical protein n=1 Tax=Soonwooa sp. TaxID=1938592 RepID=UPI00261F1061|nr:hypothetical protein [Soonwooa sp.]